MSSRARSAWAAIFLAVWFLGQTWRGIFVDFTEDDLMNMYFGWRVPPWKLFLANLTPFTSTYRPVGSTFYHIMYSVAGLHALPFRIACYAVMLLNLWLVYRVARLLTGSEWTALLCALIFSYHKRLFALLVNTGTIYDLLCLTFFLLTLAFYVSTRRRTGNVSGWHLLGFYALFTLAMNSKEMAASLPPILLAYELIYHPESLKRGFGWLWDRRAIWMAAAMTVIAFRFRQIRGSSFFGNPDYGLHFTVAQYFSTTRPLLAELFFLEQNAFTAAETVAIFAAALALGLILRNRAMTLGAAIAILAPLPINFIVWRGFFVMYVPLFGWALFFAALLIGAADALHRRVHWKVNPAAVVFAAVAVILFVVQERDDFWRFSYPRAREERIHRLRKDVATLKESLGSKPKPRRVLFLNQAVEPDGYMPLFVVRLLYRDPDIEIDSAIGSRAPQPVKPETYDLVVDYCQGRYVKAGSASCTR